MRMPTDAGVWTDHLSGPGTDEGQTERHLPGNFKRRKRKKQIKASHEKKDVEIKAPCRKFRQQHWLV